MKKRDIRYEKPILEKLNDLTVAHGQACSPTGSVASGACDPTGGSASGNCDPTGGIVT